MTTPIKAAFSVLVAIAAMLAAVSTGPVNDYLMERLGPKCKRACKYPKGDLTKWEQACLDCCDELRRGTPCYRDCGRGILPDVCKKRIDPDTGCEDE